MNWTQQQDFMRSMPDAAAKILLMMLWTGRTLIANDWADAVGASPNTITKSLQWLTERGLAQPNGRLQGWGLPNQLPLPFHTLLGQESSGVLVESYPQAGDKEIAICDLPNSIVSSSIHEEDDPLTNQPTAAANCDLTPEIEALLIRGGLVPNSPKLKLLAQKIESVDYAKAHVLEHLHERATWEKSGKKDREPGTGTLIYRLERGWAAPAMRCEDCLERERSCRCNGRPLHQHIPDHLRHIIKS